MTLFKSIDAVLDFAIEREQEAVDFYLGLAGQTDNTSLQKTLKAFAGVEQGHKEKLLAIKTTEALREAESAAPVDMKISDYLVEEEPGPEMSFQDALVVAMKREKAAMELYTDLAQIVSEPQFHALLIKLAHEEATHKASFETAYEKHFLSEN